MYKINSVCNVLFFSVSETAMIDMLTSRFFFLQDVMVGIQPRPTEVQSRWLGQQLSLCRMDVIDPGQLTF